MNNNNNTKTECTNFDIKNLLYNFIEYLYPEKEELNNENDDEYKLDEWNDLDIIKQEDDEREKLEQEILFPYPYFENFKRKGFVYQLVPKKEEDNTKCPNIYNEIKKYIKSDNNNNIDYDPKKLLEFWRLVLLDKGSMLINVLCLCLRTLEAMDSKKLFYDNEEIIFYGVTMAKMKSINPIKIRHLYKKEEFIYDKSDLEQDCYIKLLLIKLKNGKSFYFDYSLSEKGDEMACTSSGFPYNIWKPFEWGKQLKFTIFNTLDAETLQRSFSQNFSHVQECYNDVIIPLISNDLLGEKKDEKNQKQEKSTNKDDEVIDEEIATLFMLTETYINRVYSRIYQIMDS